MNLTNDRTNERIPPVYSFSFSFSERRRSWKAAWRICTTIFYTILRIVAAIPNSDMIQADVQTGGGRVVSFEFLFTSTRHGLLACFLLIDARVPCNIPRTRADDTAYCFFTVTTEDFLHPFFPKACISRSSWTTSIASPRGGGGALLSPSNIPS